MAYDAHKNFAYSTIDTPPDPTISGVQLIVATGQGGRFPAVPFNATIWPQGQQPTPDNAEVVRVTGRVGDQLTVVRQQEGTVARDIKVRDQIAATITAKALTDIEANTPTIYAAKNFGTLVGDAASATIQAAIDGAYNGGGGVVLIPPGTYACNVKIRPNVIIQGAGLGATILKAIAGNNLPVIGSERGAAAGPLDPYHCGIKSLRIDGNRANGSAGRGIDIASGNNDAYWDAAHKPMAVGDQWNDPAPIIEDVFITECGGDMALFLGKNMRGAWTNRLFVLSCAGFAMEIWSTDAQFANMQLGSCGSGPRIRSSNNMFSNCKSWYHGVYETNVGGHGWEVKDTFGTQLTGCQAQDNKGSGLFINNSSSTVASGFVSGGDETGAVYLSGTAAYNVIDATIMQADRTQENYGFLLDGAGVYNNDLTLHDNIETDRLAGFKPSLAFNGGNYGTNAVRAFMVGGVVNLGNKTGAVDLSPYSGDVQNITLTGNVTINAVPDSQALPGRMLTIVFTQDAVGGRTVTWNAQFKNPPAIAAGANAVTVARFINNSTTDTPVWQKI